MKLPPVLLLMLAGCATSAGAGEGYTARGTEPFWSVEVAGGRMTYQTPDRNFSVPAPAPAATASGRRYRTPRITMDVVPWVCSDGMSDNLYADTVAAIVDGVTLYGCGGGTVPEDELVNSSWAIQQIDDIRVGEEEDEASYRLAFRADRIVGRAGCNGFSAPYSRSGDTLIIGPVASTRMACEAPSIEHERRTLRIFEGPLRLRQDSGELVLTGPGGTLRLRRSFHAPYAVTPVNPWELGNR